MAERVTAAGRPFDYRARDAAALLAAMHARIPQLLPEWTGFRSETDFGNVLLELFAHVGDIIGYYVDAAANESFLGTAQTRDSVIEHLRLIGYRLGTAAPAATTLQLRIPAPCTGPVTVRTGAAFVTASGPDRPSVRFEYTGPELTLPCSRFVAQDGGVLLADTTIPVREGRRIVDEVLGVSDGTPHQRFRLVQPGIMLRPVGAAPLAPADLELVSELRGTVNTWRRQESLAFSGETETDVVVEIDAADRADVLFGLAVPDRGAQIRASYRVGGGEHGNVLAGTITTIGDAPELSLRGATVTNPGPATGGAARETIEHAVAHAPQVFRSLRRAVTAADYEALALEVTGVGKVRAESTGWRTVTLFVAPQGGRAVSDVLTADLVAHFEDKRSIGTRLEIETVGYVPVFVTAEVDVDPYHSASRIGDQVRRAIRAQLAFGLVTFGQVLYLSRFYEAVEALDGVAGVNITEFARDGQQAPLPPTGKIELGPRELARSPDGPADFDRHPHQAPAADYPDGVRLRLIGGFR